MYRLLFVAIIVVFSSLSFSQANKACELLLTSSILSESNSQNESTEQYLKTIVNKHNNSLKEIELKEDYLDRLANVKDAIMKDIMSLGVSEAEVLDIINKNLTAEQWLKTNGKGIKRIESIQKTLSELIDLYSASPIENEAVISKNIEVLQNSLGNLKIKTSELTLSHEGEALESQLTKMIDLETSSLESRLLDINQETYSLGEQANIIAFNSYLIEVDRYVSTLDIELPKKWSHNFMERFVGRFSEPSTIQVDEFTKMKDRWTNKSYWSFWGYTFGLVIGLPTFEYYFPSILNQKDVPVIAVGYIAGFIAHLNGSFLYLDKLDKKFKQGFKDLSLKRKELLESVPKSRLFRRD